jgi:hypothetical protein
MANFAKIEIQWDGLSALASGFTLNIKQIGDPDNNLTWTCVSIRSSAYEFSQGINAVDQASKGFSAINADILNDGVLSSKMNVSLGGIGTDTVSIEANEYGWELTVTSEDPQADVTITETPEVAPTKDFQLTGFSQSAATTNPVCSHIKITLTQNGDGVAPFTWINPSNASTTLVAEIARLASNSSYNVIIQDADTDQATLNGVQIPKLFTSSQITNISVVTNQGGFDATVTVFMADVFTFPNMTYSIDGTNFQSSSVFPNVVDGSYTLYVNDGFGCIASTPFTVDTATSIQRANPYAIVPKSNPFRWVLSGVYKYQTLDNTLYEDEYYLGQYKPEWSQPYQTNDGIILNQFRTNYQGVSARIVDCDDNLVSTLTVDQKSDNLGAQDKRDLIAFNLGNNQTGLYFTTGNIYEPGTTNIIGTHALNGQLPEWGSIGNTVILSGTLSGSFVIKQVTFNESVQANILVIDFTWTDSAQSLAAIGECTYDRLAYEVYEFEIDMSALSGLNRAEILLSDTDYTDLVYRSEVFDVQTLHKRTNFIEYNDSDVAGIDYDTGFIGKIRIRSLDAYAQMTPGGEVEQYEDTRAETVTLKSAPTMEGVFYIEAIPKGYIEKMNLIFKHFNVEINGEQWTATEFETITPDPKFALKNINVTVKRNNYEEYQTDNIDVDGTKGTIDQETGPLLQ